MDMASAASREIIKAQPRTPENGLRELPEMDVQRPRLPLDVVRDAAEEPAP